MKIGTYAYSRKGTRCTPWFMVESFGVRNHWFRYVWFGRFCIYVRTARP
jgi:hypothetical protein